MSDIFGNDSTGSMDMLVDISSATTPQETVSLTFNNDLPQFKTSSKYYYNYLCNQCLSPLTLWVWIPLGWGVLETTLWDKGCQVGGFLQ